MNNSEIAAWRPQVVALDIDGTLVDHEGVLPIRIRRAVRRANTAGATVVLTTGRSWHDTRPVFEDLGLPAGPVIASNGAVTVDFPPFELRRVMSFDPSDVIERVIAEHPGVAIAAEVVGEGFRVNRPFPPGELTGRIKQVSLAELKECEASRLVVRDPESSDADFIKLAERLGLHGVSYSVGWTAWLDIAPDGVNKATALSEVVARLGYTAADVLAIGDGRNDIEMLTWAGRGVAVGDACAEVQAAADHVTGSFAEFGAAAELDRWFGGARRVRRTERPARLAS